MQDVRLQGGQDWPPMHTREGAFSYSTAQRMKDVASGEFNRIAKEFAVVEGSFCRSFRFK